ncbi:hypothetical protein [Aestuariivirga sp.]|uniref:hypothetical protein n=1 Tax=Aestuariivirga sp. TaxID=2650926 RepID=UPI003BA9ABFA
MSYPRLTKCMPDESRYNPFFFLHKALRFGHCRMLSGLGTEDYNHEELAGKQLLKLGQLCELSRAAIAAEQVALAPALASCRPEVAASTCQDHISHLAALAELDSLMRAMKVATAQRRNHAGRTIYRCYALFAAADLARMNNEETALLTCLQHVLSDEALRLMESCIFQNLSPEQLDTLMRLMLPALTTAELRTLLSQLEADVGPSLFAELMETTVQPIMTSASSAAA